MTSYEPSLYHDSEIGLEADQWTVQDYTLAQALGVESNRTAERLVEAALDPDVAGRVTFDSEMGCFFAYAAERADADAVVACISRLVAEGPRPDMEPGTIYDSVACPSSDAAQIPPRWMEALDDVPHAVLDGRSPAAAVLCPACAGPVQIVEPVSPPLETFVRMLVRCVACGAVAQALAGGNDWWPST